MSYMEISFEQAINNTKNEQRTLLLGNGFSRSIWTNFSYDYLYQEAKTHTNSWANQPNDSLDNLFKRLRTTDFEKVLAYLNVATEVASCYSGSDFAKRLKIDKKELIDSFVKALQNVHPEYKRKINIFNLFKLMEFISHFNNIFTVNYDLLLYWIINESYKDFSSSEVKEVNPRAHFDDGFRKKNNVIIWDRDVTNQNVYYLHGSIFIFIEDNIPFKLSYKKSTTISQQILQYLNLGRTPLIVLEGKYKDKLKIIYSSPYLFHAYSSLRMIKENLFIFGFSLNEHSDMHIIEQIQKSECNNIFLSIYDDLDVKIDRKIELLEKCNAALKHRNIYVFKSSHAATWSSSTNS